MKDYSKRLTFIAVIGLLVSAYLVVHFTSVTEGFQLEKSFCSISDTFDCDAVARSWWASFLGIPVASWAFLYYLVLLLFSTQPFLKTEGGSDIIFAYALLALFPSLVLFFASVYFIKNLCIMCCVLDIANLLLFLVAYRLPGRSVGFFSSFANGLSGIFYLLFPLKSKPSTDSPQLMLSLEFWALIAVGLLLGIKGPALLVEYYFVPRALSFNDPQKILPYVQTWRKTEVSSIPLNLEAVDLSRDYSLGGSVLPLKVPPLTVVTFSDYECPHCKRLALFLEKFAQEHTDLVRIVAKDFPLDKACNSLIPRDKHKFACQAAKLARCAGQQGESLFWRAHSGLYKLDEISDKSLENLTRELGLNMEKLDSCLSSAEVHQVIVNDTLLAQSLGVLGTPAVFINGRRVQIPPEYMAGVLKTISEEPDL